jgi:putative membrane protein
MMGYGDFGSMGGLGWLWMVLILAVVVGLIIRGAISGFGSRGSTLEPTPLEILRRRYAAGEVTAAEFEQAKRTLA